MGLWKGYSVGTWIELKADLIWCSSGGEYGVEGGGRWWEGWVEGEEEEK